MRNTATQNVRPNIARIACAILLMALFAHTVPVQASELSLASAVQQALVSAPGLILAQFTIEEAEIGLEEALIGRLAGRPESEIVAARSALEEARNAYVDELVRIALEVEEAYYSVVRTQEMLQIQEANLEQANRQFAVAEARYNAGLISRQDMLEAELSHAQGVLSMERAERQVADALRQLSRLIGTDEQQQLTPHDTFGFEPFVISLEDALAEAIANRSEIKKAQRALEQARAQVIQADNAYTAPVELRKATMAARRAEIQLEQVRVQVADSIRRDWYGLQDAEYDVGAARRREQLAQDRLAITQAKFDAGMVSLLDLLRDQASASQAQLDAAGAAWDYNLAKARFLRSLGRPELPPLPEAIAEYMAAWKNTTE